MKCLKYENHPGTGVARLNIDKKYLIKLNNITISNDTALDFLKTYNIICSVNFSNRKTKQRWGTAFYKQDRIILYRHSVMIFLHEVAHITAYNHYDHMGHGKPFLRELKILIENYKKYVDK